MEHGNASESTESFQLWRHLALAGLIEGNYSGLAGSGGGIDSVVGVNIPGSRMPNAAWCHYTPFSNSYWAGNAAWYAGTYGNVLNFGKPTTGSIALGSALKPEEAWNIDTKMDDGKPGTGRIWAHENGGFGASPSTQCTTSTSATDYAGEYSLGNSNAICALKIPQAL